MGTVSGLHGSGADAGHRASAAPSPRRTDRRSARKKPPSRGSSSGRGAAPAFGRYPAPRLALLLVVLLAACSRAPSLDEQEATAAPAAAPPATRLVPGVPVAAELGGSPPHLYAFAAEAGDFLHLVVRQRGGDVVARLVTSGGEGLVADHPIGGRGEEHLLAVATETGEHRVRIVPWRSDDGGAYEIELLDRRPARPEETLLARAAERTAAGDSAALAGDSRTAQAEHTEALRLWEEAGERYPALLTTAKLAQSLERRGLPGEAVPLWRSALVAASELGLEDHVPALATGLAEALAAHGRRREALAALERAVDTAGRLGLAREEAVALNDLAVLHRQVGEPWPAALAYERSLALSRRLGDRAAEALTLRNLGVLLTFLGELPEAVDALERSLALSDGDPADEASTAVALGWAHLWAGRHGEAENQLEAALRRCRELGDRRMEAVALDRLGTLRLETGEPRRALVAFRRVRALLDETDTRGRAHLGINLAKTELAAGRPAAALRESREALEHFAGIDDPSGTAHAHFARAAALRALGEPAEAEAAVRRGIDLLEAVRGATGGSQRAAYLASVHEHYRTLVELRLDLHRAEPEASWAGAALTAAERGRARALLDLVAAGEGRRAARRLARAGELTAAEAEIARLEARRRELAGEAGAGLREVETRLRRAVLRRDRLAVLARSPEPAAPAVAEPLSTAEIRRRLAPATTLLVYHLGEERSVLWEVTRETLRLHRLAPRAELESAARRLRRLAVDERSPLFEPQTALAAAALGTALLGPVAERLAGRQLAVVAEGTLLSLPFGMLRLRDREGAMSEPLAAGHALVALPSASLAAALGRRASSREPAPELLAVFADPVFSASAPGDADLDDPTREGSPPGVDGLAPLPSTRREAQAIVGVARRSGHTGRIFTALGREATRETVTSGRLASYRLVHFATHALLHPEHPELSALALSDRDEADEPVEPLLRSYEIARLDLPAELVTLATCRTGLGEDLPGEGLVGISQSFFSAGARRVLVSLWPADDAATAHLMERLYAALLEDGEPAAAALARAQREVAAEPRYRAAYFWAGWVLQGDWR